MTHVPDETNPTDDTESKLLAYARMVKQGVITPRQYQEIKASLVGDEKDFPDPDLSELRASNQDVRTPNKNRLLKTESVSSVVSIGVLFLVIGGVVAAAFSVSGNAVGTFLGMLGVVAGVLLVSVGIAAWGARIGVIQAYAKMGLIPEDDPQLNEDRD